ncbi:MAG: ABC transporter substrate-binding protein [Alphaproteobacteria bacterium]|nr:ABC transporter substrate-binding protein [Alphaproteobacteria bacterium]
MILRTLRPVFVLFFVAVVVMAPGTRAESAQDAGAMISNLANQALQILGDKSIPSAKREAKFRVLFAQNFHIRSIGVFVLGRHWRLATPAQRKAYLDVFERFIVKTYTVRLSQYAGEKFEVVKAMGPDDRGVYLVDTVINRPDRAKISLSWTIRRAKAGLRVVDIVIENLSMAQTQREDFAAIIRKRGSIDGLIAALREKMKKLDKG